MWPLPILEFELPRDLTRSGKLVSALVELEVCELEVPRTFDLWLKPVTSTWLCTNTWSDFPGVCPKDS